MGDKHSQISANQRVSTLPEEIENLFANRTSKRFHANNKGMLMSLRSSRQDILHAKAKAFWRNNPTSMIVNRETGIVKLVPSKKSKQLTLLVKLFSEPSQVAQWKLYTKQHSLIVMRSNITVWFTLRWVGSADAAYDLWQTLLVFRSKAIFV